METAPHIAVVDDNMEIRELVMRYLGEHGYRVSAAENAGAFLRLQESSPPDLVVLDIMMPGTDGLGLCRDLRAASPVPIIFLTAIAEDTDRIVGLEMGADDYLTKPFNPRELLARIKAVLRRVQGQPARRGPARAGKVRFGDRVLDVSRREVLGPDGVAVPLSTAEFRLLGVFLEHPGAVLSRDQLLDLTLGRTADVWDRSVDNQVSRLRRKIETDPARPVLIKTCWGDGYQFTTEIEPA
ncbi:response regulator [Termitidicoccus mucosus]|uniref:Two-component system response regulator n=1 Tax=Termitidicoccus mucosus TaxID=1184151 RepID=A0A178IHT4_9BACT|nr:two-component system response regulator [Opitutaceae bacterium TSB47]